MTNLYKNIVLIGMMGSWKTTVGKILAEKMGRKFVDIDHLVEKEAKTSVSDIFDNFGEEKFRDLETKVLKTALQGKGMVISTGGGTVISSKNRNLMKQYGYVIFLRAKPESLSNRIKNTAKRPILDKSEDKLQVLRDIWEKRKGHYTSIADLVIDTDKLNPEGVSIEIYRKIKYFK